VVKSWDKKAIFRTALSGECRRRSVIADHTESGAALKSDARRHRRWWWFP